ncbi:MAG TPA: Dabb family protein, partial [Candidatus Solibacter sp.]|nr:Dabb family protein [Candidatus Solibacter sp.]
MRITNRKIVGVAAAVTLFCSGYAAGQAKNAFAQPKTVLQVSMIKWKKDVSDADRQKAMDGVKELAGKIPGIKTVWLKVDRMQPRDYDTAFALEFTSREAA